MDEPKELKPEHRRDVFEAMDETKGETAEFFLAEEAEWRGGSEHEWYNATWVRVDRAKWQEDPVYWTGKSLNPDETPSEPALLVANDSWKIGAEGWRGRSPEET